MPRVMSVLVLAHALLTVACAVTPGPLRPPPFEVVGSGGSASGSLRLTRVELFFADDLAGATVAPGARLDAQATLRFDGSGLFRGVWEADGRALGEVAFPVTFGTTVRVRTGSSVVVPTLELGPHRLTLRVVEPSPAFAAPSISYFVAGGRPGVRP